MSSTQLPMHSFDTRLVYPMYLEKLATSRRVLHLWTWVAIGGVAATIPLLGFLRWHNHAMLSTFTLQGACIALVPLVMKGIYAILLSWAQFLPTFLRKDSATSSDYERWIRHQFERLNNSSVPRHFGIGSAVITVILFWLGGALDELHSVMLVVCLAILLVSSFVYGVGLASLFFLGQTIWRLGREFPVRVSEHSFGVLSVGRTLVKCYALVAIVWCCYAASGTWESGGGWIPMLPLVVTTLIFFVSSFVVCQLPLHDRMVECKRATLLELDDLLERLTPTVPIDMSQERQRQVDFCVAEIKRVHKWPEWPFSTSNLSGVVGISIGAITPQIIQTVLIILKQSRSGPS